MHSGVTKVATERKRSSSSSYRRQAEEEEGGGGGVDDDRKTVSLQPQHRSAALHTNSSSNRTGRTDRQRTTTHAWNNTSSTTPCTSNQSVSLTLALSFSPKKTQHHARTLSSSLLPKQIISHKNTHCNFRAMSQQKRWFDLHVSDSVFSSPFFFFFFCLSGHSLGHMEDTLEKRNGNKSVPLQSSKGRGEKKKIEIILRLWKMEREKKKKNQLLDCFMLFLLFSLDICRKS